MPIAINMSVIKYKYGEYLIRAGEVPKGMLMLFKGQCNVGSQRIAYREKKAEHVAGGRGPIIDNNSLFYHFDPENSLLNEVSNDERIFQNSRIYVTEDGKQIRDQVAFRDIVSI